MMEKIQFSHVSVLLPESIESLAVHPDGLYVDCTLGGGGHALEIVKRLRGGKLVAIDRDGDALKAWRLSGSRLTGIGSFTYIIIFQNWIVFWMNFI